MLSEWLKIAYSVSSGGHSVALSISIIVLLALSKQQHAQYTQSVLVVLCIAGAAHEVVPAMYSVLSIATVSPSTTLDVGRFAI